MSLSGKVYLVTGSTDGIGKETAYRLAAEDATVLIHGRSLYKGQRVANRLKSKFKNSIIDLFIADLSSFQQIRDLSRAIHDKYDCIDVIVHNAGVFEEKRKESEDGYELTFAVNVLAPFLLTYLLIDIVPKHSNGRIVVVSCMSHSDSIDLQDLQLEKCYDGITAYELSKLCAIMMTYEMAERLRKLGITTNTLDPGLVDTSLLHAGWPEFHGMPAEEADSGFFLATDKQFIDVTGKYFVRNRESGSAEISYDQTKREKLWQKLEDFTDISFSDVISPTHVIATRADFLD
ncbi:polyprenol dehydrogenase-like [Saccoglossus kowalevskii]|uniref:Dehydrogenase/reductase SDR family member on chromosome X-like n=1 Tax=Saccoglossus kowalevskii TaxID=10224 RepID=A0ABM0GKZ5_SACKO|nr:PREDICTED: dehydrogenase/reductase SDR family member on chromosome X-like [Saccoglossus kowalevskii]